jgi:hypothetical protein
LGSDRDGDTTTMAAVDAIEKAAKVASDRFALWREIVDGAGAETVAEVGVWRGEYAEDMLRNCPAIRAYYMIDPWRNLSDWNKPFNVPAEQFAAVKDEALGRTAFAADRRRVLQGRTVEVSGQLPDHILDFCYIDGDHTLRGTLVDLIRFYPKMRDGGILGGDDFIASSWQHGDRFEPTLVFPTAIHFAEATGSIIYGLPHGQFAIVVDRTRDCFAFRDLTGGYSVTSLLSVLKTTPARRDSLAGRALRRLKAMLPGAGGR